MLLGLPDDHMLSHYLGAQFMIVLKAGKSIGRRLLEGTSETEVSIPSLSDVSYKLFKLPFSFTLETFCAAAFGF
jgi:hypothetical protein